MSINRYTEEQKTLELCIHAFIKDSNELRFIPEKFKTQEFFNIIVKKTKGHQFWLVPEKFRNKELSMLAVKLLSSNIWAVPSKYYCDELYLLLISTKIDRLRNISKNEYNYESNGDPPDIYLHYELCAIGRKFNKGVMLSEENKKRYNRGLMLLYNACCKHNGMALYYINPSYLSQELCITACCNSGMALQFVPLPLRTHALCKIAIDQAPGAKRFIPEDILSGMSPIALANAPIALIETFQHKSNQKKKIIIIKRPIVMKYFLMNKYKKIINTEKTQPIYNATPEYRCIVLTILSNIIYNEEGKELRLCMINWGGYEGDWIVIYKEIIKILTYMKHFAKYPIIFTTNLSHTHKYIHINILDNCGNFYYCGLHNAPPPTNMIQVNGSLIDITSNPTNIYNIPILNILVDNLKTIYHQEDCRQFPLYEAYSIGDKSLQQLYKSITYINSELIRANKTKRKLDNYKTENRLLKLELLEAKQMLNANKRHF